MRIDPAMNGVVSRFLQRIIELERRVGGQTIRGKVVEVDPAKKTARIQIGTDEDGAPVLSPALPYKQVAGALKFHQPPSVGQTMSITSASGDIQQGLLEPLHWSDDNQSPSDEGNANVMTFGDVTVRIETGGIVATIGGVTFRFDGNGFIQTGGQQVHDDLNVGSTHVHGGIVVGGQDTLTPH